MKQVLYINLDFINYKNKTLAQLKSFNKKGFSTFLISFEQNENNQNEVILYKYEDDMLHIIKKCNVEGKKNKGKTMKKIQQYIIGINDEYKFDIVYIRRVEIAIIFLKKMFKALSKSASIVYEFPTFPFDNIPNKKTKIYQKIELLYFNRFIKKYVKCIPIYKQNKVKENSKMIDVYNGIEIERYDISKRKIREERESINFVGIAHVNKWHGYDKFIKAIEEYEGKEKLTFTIISNKTSELNNLKEYVQNKNLGYMIFFKEYDNVDSIVNECNLYDIAVGGISYYERGAIYDTSIKNKEYCALGIPFINSCIDLSFPTDFKYMYTIKDRMIDINNILRWYESLEKKQLIKEMHQFAKENLTFDKSIQKVIDFVEEVGRK